MNTIETLIIDDSERSIALLSHYLEKYCSNINIRATCTSFKEGLAAINKKEPDLIFLDVLLNDRICFELLDIINYGNTHIIFISAHEKFAIKAIKYSPIGYLLKPFSIEELVMAVNRVVESIQAKKKNYLDQKSQNFIGIHSGVEIVLVKIKDIMFCKSEASYTNFVLKGTKKIVATKNIGYYEGVLPKDCFCRIHHKYIVNLDFIKSIYKSDGYYCQLVNEKILSISRRRQEKLEMMLHLKNS